MQATCGGSCCGAGWLYCLFYHFGLAVVPQCITRGEVRRINGLQVCHQHSTGARLCALMWNMACVLSPRTYSANLGLLCSLHHALIALPPGAVSHVACAKRHVRSRSEVVSCYWLPFMQYWTCPVMINLPSGLGTVSEFQSCRSLHIVTDFNSHSNMLPLAHDDFCSALAILFT